MKRLLALTLLLAAGCSFSNETATTRGEPVVLVDVDGVEWDVTSAVLRHGMEPDRFEFGLGKNAIKPLINPQLLSQGDRGYPGADGSFPVIGTTIAGDTRAYSRLDITRNEVVDEVIGGAHVAVAY